jgi:phosphoribosyl-dephospho-CoA transferase
MKKNKFYKENKRILNERKTKCIICGEDAKCCLEFHHLKDKLYNISEAASHIPTNLFI